MKPLSDLDFYDLNAVCIRNAMKQYGSKKNPYVIFDGLNMTVPKGSIYALLGSSGSGKSTLLNCIVGRVRLNNGEIKVLGGEPGSRGSGVPGPRIGYMPQELALFGQFTIKETFQYFGWINEMNSKDVGERIDYFMKYLTLPSENTLVKQLSGGQQRLVSLAVALLHNAELLILDEPTVGIDPIIRESVWEYLFLITESGEKTIIITTHYVQETINVDKIAFLRGGCLLAETSPSRLLKKFKTDSLEDVFFRLSVMQNLGMRPQARSCESLYRDTDEGGVPRRIQKKGLIDAESQKLSPIGHDAKGLSFAVVNFELNNEEKCNYTFDCNSDRQSCVYLNYLKRKAYTINYFRSVEESKQAMRRGKSWAALTFKRGYSDTIEKRLTDPKTCKDDEITKSQFDVYQDLSDINIGYQVKRDLRLQFIAYARDYIRLCTNFSSSLYFFQDEEPVYGTRAPTYSDSTAPGIMLTIIFFVACALTTGALLMERNDGILERSLVNGITAIEILTSHIITQFTIVFFQVTCVVVLALYVFRITHVGPMYLTYLLIILAGICGMTFGFTVAAFVNTERMATYLSLGSFLPNVLLCGIIWPIDAMPYWLRQIANVLPLTKSTEALETILHRGWGMQYYNVYIGFIILLIWCAIFLLLSGLGLKYRKK